MLRLFGKSERNAQFLNHFVLPVSQRVWRFSSPAVHHDSVQPTISKNLIFRDGKPDF
jgi:hypothetical protein